MNTLFDMLGTVSADLEQNGVIYALTGSLASSMHGQARQSLDADIVLRLDHPTADRLGALWARRFYVSTDGLHEAVDRHRMTNLVDAASGLKIDLSVLSSVPYHDQVFARRQPVELPGGGGTIFVVSPEDIILMKLEWRKETRSQRQYEDALGVVRTHTAALDWSYLKRWAHDLGVADDLNTLQADAGLD